MKLSTVVTATDLNPLYADFIPYFVQAWKTLFPELDICILVIAKELPLHLQEYSSSIRLVEPIEGVHTAFQAQCIRLLYPATLTTKDAVLITDMDMIPLNRRFYVNSVATLADDAFVSYRPHPPGYPNEIYMCYCAATPKTWKAVFASVSKGSIAETLRCWYGLVRYDGKHGGSGWITDQLTLCKAYKAYAGPKAMLRDQDTRYKRLCRDNAKDLRDKELSKKIQNGLYTDYHCRRPYEQHKAFNAAILLDLQIQASKSQTSS